MITNKKLQRTMAILLSFMMIVTIMPFDIISPINIDNELYKDSGINVAYGAGSYVGGSTGNITNHVGVRGSGGGIASAVFDDPGVLIAIYRDKDTSQHNNEKDKIFNEILTKGAPLNSKMIAPLYVYTDKVLGSINKLVIGKAVGNNALVGEKPDRVIWRANRTANPAGTDGVYYSTIKDKYGNLSNWESYVAANKTKSSQTWEYILNTSDYDISGKIIKIFGLLPSESTEKLTAEKQKEQWLKYLDFLMSLYAISIGTGSQNHWKVAIDDYVNNNNLADNPVNVIFEPATMVSAYGQGHIAISWIDYMNFYAGTANNYAIDKQMWHDDGIAKKTNTTGSAYGQYLESVKKSINDSQSLQRISRAYIESNPWSHGVSAITWYRFTTAGNVARWGNHSANTKFAVSETMWLGKNTDRNNTQWGVLAVLMPKPEDTPSVPLGRLVALPDNQPIETDTLGVPVTLDVFSGAKDADKRVWEAIIAGAKLSGENFKVTISNMTRTSVEKPGQGTYTPTIPHTKTMSPDEFNSWLNEDSAIRLIDDGTISVPVDRTTEKGVTFTYKCKLTIEYGSSGNKVERDITDKASFIILPERIGYTSKPEAYSEIKNYGSGSNMSGTLKERWEAMAGVPSTEQLYFAAGGSEFIVDVTLEYTSGEKAVRSYDSYYTATDCQFKNGDTAKPKSVPAPGGSGVSYSINYDPHAGGTVTATWTGTTKWTGSGGLTGCHTASVTNTWDDSNYNQAMADAAAWVTAVNNYKEVHTAQSDGKTRSWNSWGASRSGSNPHIPGVATNGSHAVPATKDSPGSPEVPGTYTPGQDNTYTVTVTATIPAHTTCGPCCSHVLPEIHDTWRQTFEYDSMRITDVHVWEIDQAAVDGMTEIISTDVVKAEIRSGEPNVFYNIAMKNNANYTKETNNKNPVTTNDKATYSSESGRIRYKVSPELHDTVAYNLGARTNKCDGMAQTYGTNVSANGGSGHSHAWSTGLIYNNHIGSASTNGQFYNQQAGNKVYPVNTVGYLQANTDAKDKATTEYAEFLKKRQQPQTATMITDFLILQTSNGSQSVMYYHQTTPQGSITAEHEIPKMTVTKEKMWDTNSNSASKWKEDHINVGGYNGKYKDETNKFKVSSKGNDVTTFFEPDPASGGTSTFTITRPNKPNRNLMIYSDPLNIVLRNNNKSYQTGTAEVFWQNLIHWTDVSSEWFNVNPAPAPYDTDTTVGIETGFNFGGNVGTNNDQSNPYTRGRPVPTAMLKSGFTLEAPYSQTHAKVNDIIVHDPVSTENASLISLPSSRDQRTNSSGGAADAIENINKSQVCPREPALCDFRHLINNGDCDYFRDTVLLSMDFDTKDTSGNPVNKITGNSVELPAGFSITSAPSGTGRTNITDINMWRKAGDGTLTWDSKEEAFKAVGHVQMYLKPEYSYKIDKNKTYTIKVTAKVEDYAGKTFYWGGDRLDANKAHLQGYGGTYDYSAASAVATGNMDWKTYTATKTGTAASASGWGTDTSYFSVGGLLNYSGNTSQVTWVKSIELYEDGVLVQSTEPNGIGMTGQVLKSTSGRLEIPFSELGLTYTRSLRLKVEADAIINDNTATQMLFSFHSYDAYIIPGYDGIFINTGNGAELHAYVDGKKLVDGKRHHIAIVFSMTKTDRTEVYIDGVRAKTTRINPSNEVTTDRVGKSIGIGSWGTGPTTYPLRNGYVDNFKITRLAGTTEHTEDEYILKMTHPNGLNKHVHSVADLGGTGVGADWFVKEYTAGRLTEQQAKDILGPAYDPIMANSFGPVIHTWSNWTSANTYGFYPIYHSALTYSGGNLVMTSSGNDPHFGVPVDFSANGITKVEVTLDNNTSSTLAQMFWSRNDSPGWTSVVNGTTMKANTANQTVEFVVRNNANWKNTITGLRFDLATTTGNVVVKSIKVYGPGSRTSAGSGGSGTVVFNSSIAGSHSYSAPAGEYKLEVWGAQGGSTEGGNGGYSVGEIKLTNATTLNIHIGGQGGSGGSTTNGGYNGGGYSVAYGTGGGGATHIAKRDGLLSALNSYRSDVFIVAGGGGGYAGRSGRPGGVGGGTTGGNGYNGCGGMGYGGTQTAGGTTGRNGTSASFGLGGSQTAGSGNGGAGGGGGWFGGGAGGNDYSSYRDNDDSGGGGGSGYIGGVTGGLMVSGDASMPNPSGGNMTGKTGSGHARITALFSPVVIRGGSGSDVSEGQVFNYGYTGGVQSVTLPEGQYKLEVWGAQGSKVGSYSPGLGGYSTGTLTTNSDTTVYIGVGGQGSGLNGGYNGGGKAIGYGGGGGATHISTRSGLLRDLSSYKSNILLVAGGGGGEAHVGNGGAGGGISGINGYSASGTYGIGGTQTSAGYGGGFGYGGPDVRHGGAGGGGYYGGGGGGNDCEDGGGGGSSYVGGVTGGTTIAGNASMPNPSGGTQVGQSGNGYARITALYVKPAITLTVQDILAYWDLIPDKLPNGTNNPIWSCNRKPNVHVCDDKCVEVAILDCTEPHHKGLHYDVSNPLCWEPCNDDAAHKKYKPVINTADGSFTPGNFINIDWGFQVYYPNIGDFDQGEPYGLGSLVSTRGRGFVDGLDTTKWTKVKRIKFNINVIYKNELYVAGEWITLSDYGTYTGADGSKYDETKWSNYGTEIFNDVRGNLIDGTRKNVYQFYAVLANTEMKSSEVEIDVEAVNSRNVNDNYNTATNRTRSRSFTALHGGTNNFFMDVVGRIGNLTLQDTTDYRFSNLLKTAIEQKGSTVNDPNKVLEIPELKTKEFAGATWARVLYQDISGNTNYFTPSNYLNVNRQGLFSVLGRLDDFKTGDKFEFMLNYPDSYGVFAGAYNRWKQSSNPLDQRTNGGPSGGPYADVAGYEPIHIDMPGYAGGGLEFNGSASVLDGTVGFGNWWLAVGIMNGSYTPTNTASKPFTMPGPHNGSDNQGVSQVELWVRIDDIVSGGSGEVTEEKTIHDISTLKNNTSGDVSVSGTTLYMSSPGSKVSIPSKLLPAGQYRIDVSGKSLGNGRLFVTSDASWKNVGEYDRTSTGVQYINDVNNTNFKLTGPNVDLDKGQYKMTVNGSGFTMAEFKLWENKGLTGEKILQTTAEYQEDGKITYYFTLANSIKNVSITTEFSEVTQEFTFDNIVIDKLDEGKIVDMVANGHTSKIVETSNTMAYYLTIPSDATVSLGWMANNDKGLSVANIVVTRLGDHAEGWIVDNVVRKVDEGNQNYYLGWKRDIRGVDISTETKWLNTYSTRNWMDGNILRFPLSPSQNNISILQDEPMLPGYDLLLDISTIGNYYRNNASLLQVMPYYYALNVNTGELTPLDAYMKLESTYAPVNIFNNYNENGSLKMPVYNYIMNLDWLNESVRRNYTAVEQMQTDFFRTKFAEGGPSTDSSGANTGDSGGETALPYKQLDAPVGSFYTLGNAQVLQANGKARTFIGGETTYGTLMNLGGSNSIKTDPQNERKYNPEGKVTDYDWWAAAQRWHFKIGVPSSTVFVKHHSVDSFNPDREITNNMIEEFKSSNYVILATADIRVVGDTYVLKYSHEEDNGSIKIRKKDGSWSTDWKLPTNIPPVLAVYSAEITTEYDISITRTH